MINTVPKDFLHHMAPYIKALITAGNRVVLVSNGRGDCLTNLINIKKDYFDCSIARRPSLKSDINSLIKIYKVIVSIKPKIIHTISPKAGFLGALAGFFALVPVRIHTFTGQVWANKKGPTRIMLKFLDKTTSLLCTHLLADSESQKKFLVKNGVSNDKKIDVLGYGSVCGVDHDRFRKNYHIRRCMREKYSIGESAIVFLFLGRLNRDKGVYDLLQAFQMLNNSVNKWLIFVGPCEDEDLLKMLLSIEGNVIYQNYTSTPEYYYWMSDVLCLPSYREGFGNVIIEGAAASLPCIASRIYGVTDAVEEGYSGLLHQVGNVHDIRSCLEFWIRDSKKIADFGEKARQRVSEKFNTKNLVKEFLQMYRKFGANI